MRWVAWPTSATVVRAKWTRWHVRDPVLDGKTRCGLTIHERGDEMRTDDPTTPPEHGHRAKTCKRCLAADR